jgi:hypothetical protein
MQSNLDVYSLDGRTITLPVARSQGSSGSKIRSAPSPSLHGSLVRARESACNSAGEQIAWLAVAASAIAALGLSFWF